MRRTSFVCDLCGEECVVLHNVASKKSEMSETDEIHLKHERREIGSMYGDLVYRPVYCDLGLQFDCCENCLEKIEGFVVGLKK